MSVQFERIKMQDWIYYESFMSYIIWLGIQVNRTAAGFSVASAVK